MSKIDIIIQGILAAQQAGESSVTFSNIEDDIEAFAANHTASKAEGSIVFPLRVAESGIDDTKGLYTSWANHTYSVNNIDDLRKYLTDYITGFEEKHMYDLNIEFDL